MIELSNNYRQSKPEFGLHTNKQTDLLEVDCWFGNKTTRPMMALIERKAYFGRASFGSMKRKVSLAQPACVIII